MGLDIVPEPRVYLDTALHPASTLALPVDAARHVTRVLRLRPGMPLTLFNGEGGEFDAEIAEIRGQTVTVHIGQYRDVDRESPLTLRLVQGISRGERMDWVIQKAVELGVARIEPVFMARSVVRLDARRAILRRQHWRGVAVSACEQCGRNRIPEVARPVSFGEWAEGYRANGPDGAGHPPGISLLLQPDAEKRLTDIAYTGGPITLLAGPEGGVTETEAGRAVSIGFMPIVLGPRILRTETAALAAFSAIALHWGDF
uniref:Ribosomal RNA small subunit methyltransferase E n=1 Tax=Candidatus Kentrum sp. DK TaxID=2126562 RepID=A0A450S919_9GAMM|nr:MAG: 16S rRNA m(3)U-1498 methyltransferase [Candidatus Kentron sp. DK]